MSAEIMYHPDPGPWRPENNPGFGSSSDSSGVAVYIGRDPLPPDDPQSGAISYPAGGGTITEWNVLSQTWV